MYIHITVGHSVQCTYDISLISISGKNVYPTTTIMTVDHALVSHWCWHDCHIGMCAGNYYLRTKTLLTLTLLIQSGF